MLKKIKTNQFVEKYLENHERIHVIRYSPGSLGVFVNILTDWSYKFDIEVFRALRGDNNVGI